MRKLNSYSMCKAEVDSGHYCSLGKTKTLSLVNSIALNKWKVCIALNTSFLKALNQQKSGFLYFPPPPQLEKAKRNTVWTLSYLSNCHLVKWLCWIWSFERFAMQNSLALLHLQELPETGYMQYFDSAIGVILHYWNISPKITSMNLANVTFYWVRFLTNGWYQNPFC